MRVSASTPAVTVIACASTRGWIAIARIGRTSSHSGGSVEARARALQRDRAAGLGPLRPRGLLQGWDRCGSAPTPPSICSPTVLSISGLTCAGTLTRAPATESAVSPRLTCAARFGSKCQAAASFGRDVMVTVPLISALALSALMLMLPICLAALSPSRLPSASADRAGRLRGQRARDVQRTPVSGVASDSTSWAPVAVIGPRDAVQPISAFCSTCDTGLSALPAKLRGAARSAASRMAPAKSRWVARMVELRDAGASGGNSASAGVATLRARRQPVHRLQADKKRNHDHRDGKQDRLETQRQTHRPPGLNSAESLQAESGGARVSYGHAGHDLRHAAISRHGRREQESVAGRKQKWRGPRAISVPRRGRCPISSACWPDFPRAGPSAARSPWCRH